MNKNPFVSVIVPVYNDPIRLAVCLNALESQTYPQDKYEVIVVDNNSKESLDKVVSQYPHAILTAEKKPSSYAARNKGISLAKGEILAFTDSDCIPLNNWIENGVRAIVSIQNIGLIAGEIDIFPKDKDNPTMVELYEMVLPYDQSKSVQNYNYGATANVFALRELFDKVGGFNETLKSGGDFEWGNRVYKAGYKVVYRNDVCIKHPARYSFKELNKKVIRIAMGQHDLEKNFTHKSKKINSIKEIFANKKLNGTIQKLIVLTMTIYVQLLTIFYKLYIKTKN